MPGDTVNLTVKLITPAAMEEKEIVIEKEARRELEPLPKLS